MSQTLSAKELVQGIAETLVSWPLYRKLSYALGDGQSAPSNLPHVLQKYCIRCRHEQAWERSDNIYEKTLGAMSLPKAIPDGGHRTANYLCRNCRMTSVTFHYVWQYSEKTRQGHFTKVGQFPSLDDGTPTGLEEHLEAEDCGLYRKAIRSRNNNYGLGAVSYLRRVLENKINYLLDLIADAARQAGTNEEDLKALNEVKAGRRVEDKVRYAAGILPRHLRPGGHNPIERLYGLASEAIHSLPEEHCIEVFDDAQFVFEYLFRNLHLAANEAKAYAAKLQELTQVRPPKP